MRCPRCRSLWCATPPSSRCSPSPLTVTLLTHPPPPSLCSPTHPHHHAAHPRPVPSLARSAVGSVPTRSTRDARPEPREPFGPASVRLGRSSSSATCTSRSRAARTPSPPPSPSLFVAPPTSSTSSLSHHHPHHHPHHRPHHCPYHRPYHHYHYLTTTLTTTLTTAPTTTLPPPPPPPHHHPHHRPGRRRRGDQRVTRRTMSSVDPPSFDCPPTQLPPTGTGTRRRRGTRRDVH